MKERGVKTMLWVIGATLLVSLLSLLPIIYDVCGLHEFKDLKMLWGYAPNQFLFIIIPFPFAAFCAFVGLRHILLGVEESKVNDPIILWFLNNWPVAILVGCILVCIITITDYYYTAKVFDRLQPEYASKAIESATTLKKRIEKGSTLDEKEQIRREISKEIEVEFERLSVEHPPTNKDIMSMSPALFMKVVLEAKFQRNWKLLNPTAHALSVLQIFTTILVGFIALMSLAMVHLAVKDNPNIDISKGVDALTYCIMFFAIYPLCYRYFVAEMQYIMGFESTIRADIMSSIMIIVATGIVLTIDPNRRDLFNLLLRGLPFLLVIGPSVYAAIAGPLSLRNIIGIDSNIGSRITLFIIMLLISCFVVLSIWPRNNIKNNASNKSFHRTR